MSKWKVVATNALEAFDNKDDKKNNEYSKTLQMLAVQRLKTIKLKKNEGTSEPTKAD